MTTFDDRKDKFENKFAHDAELRFRAEARRNKMLGRWAAERLGLSGDKAEDYATSVIMADLEEPGDEDVFRKVRGDFDKAGVAIDDETIRRRMSELLQLAAEEIQKSG
ncbi:MAG: DUF1476 family protein [Alphaproteobacteria bacterium]|nr:DUF1476 family protein [Alphaproteobacteria bacterium]